MVTLKGSEERFRALVEQATSQVGLAVAASALTNIVVFLPIATMTSITGRFLAPFAVTVTVATFASLLISFTLTPILAVQTFPYGARFNRLLSWALKPWNVFYAGLERGYVRSLHAVLKAPLLFVAVAAALSGTALWYYAPRVQMDFVPQTDMSDRGRQARIDQVPVVDPEGRPVGLLDVQDLLAARLF